MGPVNQVVVVDLVATAGHGGGDPLSLGEQKDPSDVKKDGVGTVWHRLQANWLILKHIHPSADIGKASSMRSSQTPASGISPVQEVASAAISRLGVPAAGASGALLAVIALLAGRTALLGIGIMALGVMALAWWQLRRSAPHPAPVLVLVSSSFAILVTLGDRALEISTIPVLVILALVAVFTTERKVAIGIALWCALLVAWSILWIHRGLTLVDVLVIAAVLVGTGVSAFMVFVWVDNARVREEENYRLLFDSSPVAVLEEDYTTVMEWLNGLRRRGVNDIRRYLWENRDELAHGISKIRIVRPNPAAARMLEAASPGDLVGSLRGKDRTDAELASFLEQFVALWEGRRELALDLNGTTLTGRPMQGVLHWSVPASLGRADLSRVIVTISDITPRREVEERLAKALRDNEQLLSFEQALAACSRALLLGLGEDALEVALEKLRQAIDADRAFLALNLDDHELGPAFQVIKSSSKPEHHQDDWVGMTIPWNKYPTALESLSQGEAFRHTATTDSEQGRNRSLLAVPVFIGDRWAGTVGFVDIERKTNWSNEAVGMLEVAAPMLGSYWERETTRQRLEEMVRSKDRFLASVSHELRTPLAAVLGFAEELKAHASSFRPEELTEMLELIAEESQDMADMVEDLLVAARADIGTISIHPQDVYLRSQAEAMLAAANLPSDSRVTVVGGPGKTWADPTRTRQIIRNLLTNAVRYGGSNVVVEASYEGNTTLLSVRDDGPGLSENDWERIFEPYQRAHDAPTQPASIGLGLTVSRQLARLMGGDLSYQAVEGGSVFQLRLPSAPPDEALQESAHPEGQEQPAASAV